MSRERERYSRVRAYGCKAWSINPSFSRVAVPSLPVIRMLGRAQNGLRPRMRIQSLGARVGAGDMMSLLLHPGYVHSFNNALQLLLPVCIMGQSAFRDSIAEPLYIRNAYSSEMLTVFGWGLTQFSFRALFNACNRAQPKPFHERHSEP
jgi:hypothetical protein